MDTTETTHDPRWDVPYAETPIGKWGAKMEQDDEAVTLSGDALKGVWATLERNGDLSLDEVIDHALRVYFGEGL